MVRTPIKSTEIEIEGQRYQVQYFEHHTLRGGRRYSCEVALDDTDRIIVDGDSLASLESKVARLAPATVYSRLLASGASFAA